MITEWALQLVGLIVEAIFAVLDILPNIPQSVISAIDSFFGLIFQGVHLVSFFVPMDMVAILIPLVIAIVNFDKIWKVIMFIIRKIPFLGIE